jgi:hypothetical protein
LATKTHHAQSALGRFCVACTKINLPHLLLLLGLGPRPPSSSPRLCSPQWRAVPPGGCASACVLCNLILASRTCEVSDDGFLPRCRSMLEASRELEAIKDATLTRVFDPNFFAARQDTNTPWQLIPRTTKHNVIDDDKWRHFWTVYTYYDFTYPSCRAPKPPRTTFDHSHSCYLRAPPVPFPQAPVCDRRVPSSGQTTWRHCQRQLLRHPRCISQR